VKKKKLLICLAGIGIYSCLAMGLCYMQYRSDLRQNNVQNTETGEVVDLDERRNAFLDLVHAREYVKEVSLQMYSGVNPAQRYAESERMRLLPEDIVSLVEAYNTPMPERMDKAGTEQFMSELQVLKRIENLQMNPYLFYTPEYDWKVVYQDSLQTVKEATDFQKKAEFDGDRASQLNAFLQENTGKVIEITAEKIVLDEPIKVPSNVVLEGNHARLVSGGSTVRCAILVDKAENVGIMNFFLDGCSRQGIYVVNSSKVLVFGNETTGLLGKSICVMDRCSYVNLAYNTIYENAEGGIFTNGDISDCIYQGNVIYNNRGTRNQLAGMVFSSMPVNDPYNVKNPFPDEHLYNLLESPHRMVVLDNAVENNYSSGIYCDGGYQIYFLENTLADNEKEGMCLDYGAFGNYVARNKILRNGERNRQGDWDLRHDFIFEAGRLENGSSPFKLPGISLDNAAYNIVADNEISNNSGSGVKMVRSAYRNLIAGNRIVDNNQGKNDKFHGFGVELGYASEPDEPVVGLDFTPDYENIITRNSIEGSHYAGVFLASESYCNDVYFNMITDCEQFSVETHSGFFNSCVDNLWNCPMGDFSK